MLQLDRKMTDDLEKILNAASAILKEAHAAYDQARLTSDQIACVTHLRNDLGQLLAKLGDGEAYTGGRYQRSALGAMRCYEEMADAWLRAVYAAAEEIPRDEWQRIKPGRYLVTRTQQTDQGIIYRQATCTNPAVATASFNQTEAARAAA